LIILQVASRNLELRVPTNEDPSENDTTKVSDLPNSS
jgi:hypothetical protein